MNEETKAPFEQRLARLQEIVAKIEGQTLPLSEAMAAFEEGRALIESLETELKEAEDKVKDSLKGSDEN